MISRREFVKIAGVAGVVSIGAALTGCGSSRAEQGSSAAASAESASAEPSASAAASEAQASMSAAASEASASGAASASDAIVVYFSRAGENYGVGVVSEGNTSIIAKMIADRQGADLFEIVPSVPYPEGYDECCDVALEEQNAGARPAYEGDIDLSGYSTVYLGYPIWWGDLPMCVYTYVESHDWAGKQVHPFCTHAGSGLSGTDAALRAACAGAEVGEGLSIAGETAQNSRDEAQADVDAWLA